MDMPDDDWEDLDGTPMPPPPLSERAPTPTEPVPYRYEDQYGNERWSDTHEKVR
jgi:hypothetical protein